MNINEKQYKIVFTNDARKEMDDIYYYISDKLYALKAAKKLMRKVDNAIQNLKDMPKRYATIKKFDELKLEYRRILIDNYAVIYTIDGKKKIIYIVHMYYGGSDYINRI